MAPEEEIPRLEQQLRALDAERNHLLEELRKAQSTARRSSRPSLALDERTYPTTAADRVALFHSLFAARTDVYPRRWENARTGRSGYSPHCEAIWKNGRRLKPTEIFQRFGPRMFSRLSLSVAEAHLRGEIVVGTYAIRPDDTCIFLAADFDGDGWKWDAAAYREECDRLGVQCLVEISRSGNGAHVWILFAEAVPAALARQLGSLVLTRAAARQPHLRLDTYDRFFPNQDFLPKGGFGNLIALPLQKGRRSFGFTEFVDQTFSPFSDQWKELTDVDRLTIEALRALLNKHLAAEVGPDADPQDIEVLIQESVFEDPLDLPALPPEWKAWLNESMIIPATGLSERMNARLKQLATIPNPVFFEKQRQRFPTYNIPRYLFSGEAHDDRILLPRGCREAVVDLFAACGARLLIEDRRLAIKGIRIKFSGELTSPQKAALHAIGEYEHGVLVAPPGSGKTVIACALIAKRKTPTLILVNRQTLLGQWLQRLQAFLGLSHKEIGQMSGTRKKPGGRIDIAMIQTLSNLESPKAFFRSYGAVIIDECHHVPAVTLETLLKECGCRYITGLTATPQRKDRLEELLFQQCGPIRHFLENPQEDTLHKEVCLRTTHFTASDDEGKALPLHLVWQKLFEDRERNALIVSDIVRAIRSKRVPIVLSDRKDHLACLQAQVNEDLGNEASCLPVLEGSLSARQRNAAIEEFLAAIKEGCPACLFATSSLLGEGFDLPALDTLFLAMPISFKGRLIQYAGRLHRISPGKDKVTIYDYFDEQLALTASMYRKRLPAYRQMGYNILRDEGKLTEAAADELVR